MSTGRVPRMTADTDNDPSGTPTTVHEPARRSGSIVLVLLVAGGIVAVAIALMTIGRAQAQPYILALLALLAMVGLFNLFAFAAGIIRFANRSADDPIMGHIADHAVDGLAVTDPRGQIFGVVDRRHHPRPRAAGGRVQGVAARHRISRSCAVRLLLGQFHRRSGLCQCDAG